MVVQHNLQAMNANRMLGITSGAASKSTEKLSSGYRINRAADDAAGLAISEKMRKQIRGLDQASENAEDGISCVQTAEGALAEVQDMLQRMNELVVQAANGTNSVSDRQFIQDEIDQLVTEIDRVSEATKFNEIYLLKGDEESNGTYNNYITEYVEYETPNDPVAVSTKNEPPVKYNYVGNNNIYFVEDSITASTSNSPKTANVVRNGDNVTPYLHTDAATVNNSYKGFMNINLNSTVAANGAAVANTDDLVYDATTSVINAARDLYIYNTDTKTMTRVEAGAEMTKYLTNDHQLKPQYRLTEQLAHPRVTNELGGTAFTWNDATRVVDRSKAALYDSDGNEISEMALHNYFDENGAYKGGLFTSAAANAESEVVADGSTKPNATIGKFITQNTIKVANALEFDLHVGADSTDTNKISASIVSLSSAGLGIDKLHSNHIGIVDKTGANATSAIDVIADALQKVSTQRSALGAVQNRLEHTIKNLDNVVENTQSAESAIRDTDMAEEMVAYSNNNILLQAGQSMLSQANQANQGILSLLQ